MQKAEKSEQFSQAQRAADPDHLWRGSVGVKKAACGWGDLGWPSGSGATGTGASCTEPTTPPVVRPSSTPWKVLQEKDLPETPFLSGAGTGSSVVWNGGDGVTTTWGGWSGGELNGGLIYRQGASSAQSCSGR